MKRKLIIAIAIPVFLGLCFYVVNWIILPRIKANEKVPSKAEAPCDGPVSVSGIAMNWAETGNDSFSGQIVTIEGYPELPLLMLMENGRASVHLTPRMNQATGGMVILMVKEGNCENSIKTLPSDYDLLDMVLYDNNGEKTGYGQKIRVTGKTNFEAGECRITVDKIERLTDSFDYAKQCSRLTEKTKDKTLVYAEGMLTVPGEQRSLRLEMDIEDATLSYPVSCKIKYGPLNNQADELPEDGYSDEDVLIRDNAGRQLRAGDNVRVYGTWSADKKTIWVERIDAGDK